jgi:hypothetical protein
MNARRDAHIASGAHIASSAGHHLHSAHKTRVSCSAGRRHATRHATRNSYTTQHATCATLHAAAWHRPALHATAKRCSVHAVAWYHIISYHIISYHIISYHASSAPRRRGTRRLISYMREREGERRGACATPHGASVSIYTRPAPRTVYTVHETVHPFTRDPPRRPHACGAASAKARASCKWTHAVRLHLLISRAASRVNGRVCIVHHARQRIQSVNTFDLYVYA